MSGLSQRRPCERDDVAAIVPALEYWNVDDDGEVGDYRSEGESTGLEQYVCFNCSRCFEPEDADRPADWDRAWQAVLDHLPRQDAREIEEMSCCLPSRPKTSSNGGAV